MSGTPQFIAYKVTHVESGKAYIGITTRNLKIRWKEHRICSRRFGVSPAIRKHGPSAFSIEQIASAKSLDDLHELERTLIKQHGTLAPAGYNLSGGGDGTWNPSEETRRRISIAARSMSDATKKKISDAGKGRRKSAETCAKIGAVHRGLKRSPETVERIRTALLARPPRSPEWSAKIAAAHRGRKLPSWHVEKASAARRGQKRTDEQRARMSESAKLRRLLPISKETRRKLSEASLRRWGRLSTSDAQGSLF